MAGKALRQKMHVLSYESSLSDWR